MSSKKITKVKLPKKDEIHTYVITSDWHSEALDSSSYNILKKFSKTLPKKNRRLVINGDFLDAAHLMGAKDDFKLYIKRANGIEDYFLPLSEDEFSWGNKILDEMQSIFDYIYFVSGNHDWRYDWFKNTHSPIAYAHNFDFKKQLHLKERGIAFIDYNNYLDIGNLVVTHGFKHGQNHTKQMYGAVGKSVLYGHVHHVQMSSFFHREIPKRATSLPCMCGLNPEYTKKWGEKNWSNGFATVNVKSNGNFNLHIHDIWDKELVLPNGKIIRG